MVLAQKSLEISSRPKDLWNDALEFGDAVRIGNIFSPHLGVHFNFGQEDGPRTNKQRPSKKS